MLYCQGKECPALYVRVGRKWKGIGSELFCTVGRKVIPAISVIVLIRTTLSPIPTKIHALCNVTSLTISAHRPHRVCYSIASALV